ncbi:MAG: hypothetical protein IT262_14000, partial [Saprospiraceae bacterium]|nr:hypothetical protein [Saprospiraceae bacterium]
MRNRSNVVFCLFLFMIASLSAQDRSNFPWWDYRSSGWLNGRIGVGMQFSNQNSQLYFF